MTKPKDYVGNVMMNVVIVVDDDDDSFGLLSSDTQADEGRTPALQ